METAMATPDLGAFLAKYPVDERAYDFFASSSRQVQEEVLREFQPKTEGEASYARLFTSLVLKVRQRYGEGRRQRGKGGKGGGGAPAPQAASEGAAPRREKRGLGDLRVGMELEGTVKFRSDRGVWVDIGYEKNARINATRQLAFRLKRNQRVATTVQAVDPRRGEVWVSAADLPTLRPWEALQVGMTTEGRVAFRSSAGVFVDIGFEQNGIVLAANRSQMFEALKQDQIVAATVEGVDGSTIRVSVAGVPKPRSLQELRVGETLEGAVGSKTERGVFVDVGCEKPALVIAPREEAYALGRSQPVTATVERVQGDVFWVSVAGLPKLPFPEELQVGSIVNGTVARKSTEGVLLDIGNAEMARVLAPRAM
ncbi:unnamed protein product, partial [Prorocentrum cordatum]